MPKMDKGSFCNTQGQLVVKVELEKITDIIMSGDPTYCFAVRINGWYPIPKLDLRWIIDNEKLSILSITTDPISINNYVDFEKLIGLHQIKQYFRYFCNLITFSSLPVGKVNFDPVGEIIRLGNRKLCACPLRDLLMQGCKCGGK